MKNKLYITLLSGALVLGSCSKDFLETHPSEFASEDQIADASEDRPGLQLANISGLYSTMIQMESGGTTGHDDFGQKGYDIYSDMLSSDMVLDGYNYGWYQAIAEYQSTVDYTSNNNYIPWRFYYRIVFGANNVVDGLGGNDAELEEQEAREIMGQAKAMRAYSYFYLAQLYSEGYDASKPILPIYTTVSDEASPLSPASEVYDLIISDLTEAIDLLEGFSRTAKNQINQDVARGLLSYAYAAKGDYAKVQEVSDMLINAGNYPIITENRVAFNGDSEIGGFKDAGDPSWMWGVDITLDNGLDLVSWWGQVDLFTYSYASVGDGKVISSDLYNAIPNNDVRKSQFVDVYGDGSMYPINKFYPSLREIQGQREVDTDYIYMRIAEMYLLNAEAAAKNGDEAAAKQSLKELVSKRMDDASYIDALSGQALQDEIYFQTRVELWGEGKVYLALKRNEKTITLPSNHLTFPGDTYPYNADELSLEIPRSEVQNNPNISQ